MKKNILFLFVLQILLQQNLYSQSKKLPPITPRWALEHIVWEDGGNTQLVSEKLVNLYLEHDMPVGAIIIDSPWTTAYNNFEWDTKRYPNSTKMIQDFNAKGVKVILWLTGCINLTGSDVPIQKAPAFDEVIEKGYAVNNGKVSSWWKGDGVHIDFTNPDAVKWWNSQIDKVMIDGVYGFKVDQGEVYFGDTVETSIGSMTNEAFRKYYYNSMYQYATNLKTTGAILGRPFSHQGGVEASVEELSLGWCGDFEGSWDGLKLQINNIYKTAELGYGAPGCEVGGFWKARPSKNELIRYAQFGAFTANMINGGENGGFTNHLPWFHGEEANASYKQVVWLHSQLIPYLFSTIVDAHKNGGSLIKNPSFEQESHMVGNYIFTKAITSENNTISYNLPKEGKWMDFWSRKVINGGTTINKTYPLNEFPLFLKEGAIIPMNITNDYSGIGDSTLKEKQTILIVAGKEKTEYNYYRPTGDGIEYDPIKIIYDGLKNEISVKGKNKLDYAFIVLGNNKPIKVKKADSWKYAKDSSELLLIKSGNKFKIKLK
ncbi:TIM-barrel domain-containing protein [Thalassobellus citreus]|uniref:TIM-barrel domain-containing protein n=1 Tax=Thalassobellus citreus TaxID=3367752 RepID=UPI0037B7CB6C